MIFNFLEFNYGTIIILAALLLGMIANGMVKGKFRKFSKISTKANFSGFEIARRILDNYGLSNIDVEEVKGNLTDHYDPRKEVLRLSTNVFSGRSIAAAGIAAHEAGHAVQDAMGYQPFKMRQKLFPIANLGSQMLFPLIIGGFFFNMTGLLYLGAALYAGAFLFQVVTLPVEFNASNRAVAYLQQTSLLSPDEMIGVRQILNAAALTYVAAALASLGQMVWLLLAGRNR